jgi:excinuclease ABC subunit C
MSPRLLRSGVRTSVALLPSAPGVYRFRDARGGILYIGRAVDLRRRVGSYWSSLDRRRLHRMVERIDAIEVVVCDSDHEAAWLERNLLERSLPRWNRTRGGETAAFIRLDLRTDSSGVGLVHTASAPGAPAAARDFGPYLGGTQTRLAVSALNRVYPISYTSDRLHGVERDLADARGVVPADRDVLIDKVIAVLEREPGAVADVGMRLAERRDEAAGRLAFELAGRIQAESSAIAWVVAEQKVTNSVPDDTDVYGWAAGLLVGFGIRAGRMTTWTARACGEPAARGRVDGTAPMWRDFAQRNAELAVRLRQHARVS